MQLTIYKTFTSYISSLPNFQIFSIENQEVVIDIKSVKHVKYLGIPIDSHMKWDEHANVNINKQS